MEAVTFVGYTPKPREEDVHGREYVPELRDAKWLQSMADQGATTHEIAALLDCSQSLVAKWMNKFDVKPAGRGCKNPLLDDAEWLKEKYESGETLAAMAREIGCGEKTLRGRFRKYKIDTRGPITAKEVEIPEWETYPERREGELTREVICMYVAMAYNVKLDLVMNTGTYLGSKSNRKANGANGRAWHARRAAIWLTRNLLGWNATRIGRAWGYANSDRALAAFRHMDTYVKSCPAFAEEVRRLTQDIKDRA